MVSEHLITKQNIQNRDEKRFAISLIQIGKIVTTADDVYAFAVMPGNRN